MTHHVSLYARYRAEIAERRMRDAARPTNFRRNVIAASELLQRLCRQLDYRPPVPHTFPGQLRDIQRRGQAEADARGRVREQARAKHSELTELKNRLTQALAAVSWERSSVDEVAALKQGLDAACLLLSLIPKEALSDEGGLFEAAAGARQQRGEEIAKLRAWLARLKTEHARIKSDIDECERRGGDDTAPHGPSSGPGAPLRQELDVVLHAIAEAEESLRLAGEEAGAGGG